MKTKYIFYSLLIIFLSIVLSGCATTVQYSRNGNGLSISQIPFDIRIAQANIKQRQDYNRGKSIGFASSIGIGRIGSPTEFMGLSDDQKKIVQLIGNPEYYCSFPTQNGKRVTEWVYLTQDYLVQFRYGKLVYLGPVDDKEKTIIDLGPPTDIYTFDFASGRQEIFVYKSRWEIKVFHNDDAVEAN
jgi:hypothetical protein